MKKLGIIAGGGELPNRLIQWCQKEKKPYCIAPLKGHAVLDRRSSYHGRYYRLGQMGKILNYFLTQGVTEVVLIGSVRRPSLREIIPDWYTFKFLCSIWCQKLGDDALLRRIIQLFEKEGMNVIGIQDVLPNLQVPEGVLGKISPNKLEKSDIEYGFRIAKKLGQVDVGQGVIVQQGLVLSLEGIEGTDALIQRTKYLKRKGGSGVLVKVSKPQQDLRVDMPTIGVNTVRLIHESGLKGIAVEADAVLLVDVEKTVALADKLGIFILGVKAK